MRRAIEVRAVGRAGACAPSSGMSEPRPVSPRWPGGLAPLPITRAATLARSAFVWMRALSGVVFFGSAFHISGALVGQDGAREVGC